MTTRRAADKADDKSADKSTDTETVKADVTAPDADAKSTTDTRTTAASGSGSESGGDQKKSGTRYLNTTNGPVVYDAEGHSVDGGAWIELSGLDAVGRAARQHGHLMPQSALS
jgi:hypothetical protein